MSSWAAIAKSEPTKPVAAEDVSASKPRVAVVDANAIITGAGLLNLARFADRVVTVPEVLREVRDKQSRQTLASLPFTIETREPDEDSLKAVVRFARATGDVHSLSNVDVRLIALARTMEVAAHGDGHLRALPAPPAVQKARVRDDASLPGWGAQGGKWAEMDRLNEEELAAAEAALMQGQVSRIVNAVGDLTLGNGPEEGEEGDEAGGSGEEEEEEEEESSSEDGSDAEGGEGEDDGEWETAAKNRGKARRQKRNDLRYAQRQQRREAEAAAAAAAAESGSDDYTTDDGEEEEGGEEGEEEDGAGPAPSEGGFESSVCSITADFAMQNVIVQMGLRLVTPDGRRIGTVSRWVLRCGACYMVTKEMGRLFCPRCGNATMDKVRVVVGPDGSEQYGVGRKHILKGTRFSLPKPKGGRARDVILREDVLMQKAAKARRRAARKAASEEVDPFAPEYGQDTWHQVSALPGADRGAAPLLAGWRCNPNERRHVATNRRRK